MGVVPSIVEYVLATPEPASVGVRVTVGSVFSHAEPIVPVLSPVTGAAASGITPNVLAAVRPEKSYAVTWLVVLLKLAPVAQVEQNKVGAAGPISDSQRC